MITNLGKHKDEHAHSQALGGFSNLWPRVDARQKWRFSRADAVRATHKSDVSSPLTSTVLLELSTCRISFCFIFLRGT